jgi:glycosyltransferase involved in cell wall biosynthesis
VKISIVIPAFNEEKLLGDTLQASRAATDAFMRRDWGVELIVCDNNSTDATARISRAAGARVVFEPVNQIARARNTGAAHATGDWILFIDADCRPTPGLFADVAEAIGSGSWLAGGSTLEIPGQHPTAARLLRIWNVVSRTFRLAAGSFIFCDAEAFREVGGFNQELYAGEEIDLFRRLKRAARARGLTIDILHGNPLRTSDRKAYLYTRGELVSFIARTIVSGGRTLRNRDECFGWYDGRR